MTRSGVAPRRLRLPVRRPKGRNGPDDVTDPNARNGPDDVADPNARNGPDNVADPDAIYCRTKVLIRLLALSEASDCINSFVRQYTGGGIHRRKRH